ncbi:MAG: dephospho-CoA kinase [Proteobacteria bacterium]|nr:dephospho-CoA kinase [Pseudomonadota bacterium]
MLLVGLTGNIGSGKSTVSAMFEKLGAKVLDADKMARDVVAPGQKAYQDILNHFGEAILCQDLTIKRKKLADIVFKNKTELAFLNRVTHREISLLRGIELQNIYEIQPKSLVINDIPLIFESKLEKKFQAIIVISIDKSLQISRLQQLRGLEIEDIEARINNQISQDLKIEKADWVISNNGNLEATENQVKQIYSYCMKLPQLPISEIVKLLA